MMTYEMKPSELEETFRREGLPSDRRVLLLLLVLAALFHLVSVSLDQRVLGGSQAFLPVFGIRVASAVIALVDISVAFLCANLLGLFVSREVQGWRRRQFLALRKETEARAQLEKALLELKILRRIIPICSHCKSVRTDAGDWERVETYVRSHSEAELSHGICPDCLRKHYPGV